MTVTIITNENGTYLAIHGAYILFQAAVYWSMDFFGWENESCT